ncbi:MAG: phosphonate-binding protein [Rhizobiaceae bacterium]|nr:phosphonate-binding protein [Rhizobiaceae bacterium]
MVLALVGRQTHSAPELDVSAVAQSVDLRFSDLPDGTVVASNAATGSEIERIAPGAGGFIRVTMRSFAGDRMKRDMTDEVPFQLARMNDGDLLLRDPLTGRSMLLNAFGPSNERAFAQLIEKGETRQ